MLFSCALILILMSGCCNELAESPPDLKHSKKVATQASKHTNMNHWLTVHTKDLAPSLESVSQISSSTKIIKEITFEAHLEDSNRVKLEVDGLQILHTDAASLWTKFKTRSKTQDLYNDPIWQYKGSSKDQNFSVRTGSMKFSEAGDQINKISFIISLEDS